MNKDCVIFIIITRGKEIILNRFDTDHSKLYYLLQFEMNYSLIHFIRNGLDEQFLLKFANDEDTSASCV